MKKQNILLLAILFAFGLVFTSCVGDEKDDDISEKTFTEGLFVLNEGNWGMNNAALSFYEESTGKVETDVFSSVNQQGLGDTGNDMIVFGNHLIIAVKESANLTVINKNTGKLVKRIPIVDEEGTNRMPSRLWSGNDKIYLTTMDGNVIEINTNTYAIERTVKVGRNPEGIIELNNKLYVVNSGGLDYPNYDNTLSIIDASTMQEIKKVEIGVNPYALRALQGNNIGIMVTGNYSDIPTTFKIFDANSEEIKASYEVSMINFDWFEDDVIFTEYDWNELKTLVKVLDVNSGATSTLFSSSEIAYPYYIKYNKDSEEILISDAKDFSSSGEVFVFSLEGEIKHRFSVANIPSVILMN